MVISDWCFWAHILRFEVRGSRFAGGDMWLSVCDVLVFGLWVVGCGLWVSSPVAAVVFVKVRLSNDVGCRRHCRRRCADACSR